MKTLCFMYSLTKWAWTGALIRLVWSETWQQPLWTRQKEKGKIKRWGEVEEEEVGAWGVKQSCDYYPNKTDVIRDSEEIAQLCQCCKTPRLWWEIKSNCWVPLPLYPQLMGKNSFHPAISFMTVCESGLISLMLALLSWTQAVKSGRRLAKLQFNQSLTGLIE